LRTNDDSHKNLATYIIGEDNMFATKCSLSKIPLTGISVILCLLAASTARAYDLLVFHIDNPGGENRGYIRVGSGINATGASRGWVGPSEVPFWFGSQNLGGDIAAFDIDGNGLPEVVILHIDNPGGENRGYYRIGWNLDPNGMVRSWNEPIAIPGWFGSENQGAGVAVADIDHNGRPDLAIFHIDNPSGENRGYYRIGWDLDTTGKITHGYSSVTQVPGWFGSENQGGDIALADMNDDGAMDLLVSHIDNPQGENRGYYRIGWGLDASGNIQGGWTSPQAIPGWFGSENQGCGIGVADLNGNGRKDLVVFHIDNPNGENHGYYRVGWDVVSGVPTGSWTVPTMVPGWFGSENQGGGITLVP